ncbi:activated RNA polymerase II transcriptional coactivator p15 [Oryctolagus cuniculus]|uniref:activated RNA polymerase II transcriptional coactivator p15 n=1 Tax=Oryctolagus cuniculus TaxID=9986 RepID=UPI003878F755
MPKSKELVPSSGSDADSEDDNKLKRKKHVAPEKPVKTQKMSGALSSSKQSGGSREESMFQIGKVLVLLRSIGVQGFKGKVLADIPEYWVDPEGEMKAGRNGVALKPKPWSQLKEQVSNTDAAMRKL